MKSHHFTSNGVIFGTLICALIWASSASAQQRPTGPQQQNTQPPRTPPGQRPPASRPSDPVLQLSELDERLRTQLRVLNVTAIDKSQINAPLINDPVPQLGKQLFFSKNLGGEQSAACVTCHHPVLGGGDNLSLSVGVDATDLQNNSAHDLLGIGRHQGESINNQPLVPRNAPTIFNIILNNTNAFWDGRIARLPEGGIVTPESTRNESGALLADPSLPIDSTIAAVQARFPVTSEVEMRDEFLPGIDNQTLRAALAGRLNNLDPEINTLWPQAFELAFGDPQVNVDRITHAIGEYERSMLFVDSPWQSYLQGNNRALTTQQKRGAELFFNFPNAGGAGCVACHNGSSFSDGRFHLVAFPQIGTGKGNNSGNGDNHDFGRENVTGDAADRYHFRTPSLLNVAHTAPYGHSGSYQTLRQVIQHYNNPTGAVNNHFAARRGEVVALNNDAPVCNLPQLSRIAEKNTIDCASLLPEALENSRDAVAHLQAARNGEVDATSPLPFNAGLNNQQVGELIAFLNALSDPCVADRICLSPWILDQTDEANFPDQQLLIAVDEHGQQL